jgi:hypothetical protein
MPQFRILIEPSLCGEHYTASVDTWEGSPDLARAGWSMGLGEPILDCGGFPTVAEALQAVAIELRELGELHPDQVPPTLGAPHA